MAGEGSASADPPFGLPHPLPVMAMRGKILEKIQENRVTLIVGDTGCGKSSQVPQFLLEEDIVPILCTQPRRLAVVAIARMVAKARNCEVGGEVGYHIGHSNVSDITSSRSRLVFKTAGVLLEQIRDKGAAALKYKVIILDEVHERSVESDLVLASIKQFLLKKSDFRLVLMSATADIARYRDYFKELGRGERVEVIAIPAAPKQNIFQRRVLYLEQVPLLLGVSSNTLMERYCSGSSPSSANADLKPEVHSLIHQLVLDIHANEPDIEKSILIFLPTYCALEQQWILLKPLCTLFKIHILHRSIDTDQALLAMKICKSHRKVILATNIAESSVTIPEVAFVIDSCRSLQVFWDPIRKSEAAELVWVSKSQAEQRKGRTGRTCDGLIYRLVTGKFYNSLSDHEFPAILRLSLRQQVLMMCCAGSKAINDPKALLQKVLDPPNPELVQDALDLLVQVHALEGPSHRGRYEPTYYGRLLDSLPLPFESSVLTLMFGEIGLLREGILIGILMDIQPLPIFQPFGQQVLCAQYLDNYFDGIGGVLQLGKKEAAFIGNLCAFQFWQCIFKDKQRMECLKYIGVVDGAQTSFALNPILEEEWCYLHNLVLTSLHNINDIYEDIVHVIHRYRPKFIGANRLPSYLEPSEYMHTCNLIGNLEDDDDHHLHHPITARSCISTPFVTSTDFQSTVIAERLKNFIKEMRLQYSKGVPQIDGEPAVNFMSHILSPELCRFYINGLCNKGNQCAFSHSLEARRPICKFFLTLQGCRYGSSCLYSHDSGPRISSIPSRICWQEHEIPSADSFLQLLPVDDDSLILIMNDKHLLFSSNFSSYYHPSSIIVTTPHPYGSDLDNLPSDVVVLWDVTDFCHSIIETKEETPIPWKNVKTVLWFPELEDDEGKTLFSLLQRFFEFLAVRILIDSLCDVRVILTMNNIRFSLLKVEKLARECFFFLTQSFPFDASAFGDIPDTISAVRPMQVSMPITYVFEMRPPPEARSRGYTAALREIVFSKY
ncbi:RNA helicase protein [Dioscorea alata]|uniref:RNA helicase protein n=1 Tax=Dioscorea alata TaxID=55571 RepID=A0ACB7VQ76_DIOAL|nr:RNA helicase protein [Dioscorea alata]